MCCDSNISMRFSGKVIIHDAMFFTQPIVISQTELLHILGVESFAEIPAKYWILAPAIQQSSTYILYRSTLEAYIPNKNILLFIAGCISVYQG